MSMDDGSKLIMTFMICAAAVFITLFISLAVSTSANNDNPRCKCGTTDTPPAGAQP